jgi:hypothetical protein
MRLYLQTPLVVLAMFSTPGYRPAMPNDEKLSPAEPQDLAGSIAFALLFSGRKRVHDSDKYMAAIVADRVVKHLERARHCPIRTVPARAGFVVMRRPPIGGGGDNPGRTGTPGR